MPSLAAVVGSAVLVTSSQIPPAYCSAVAHAPTALVRSPTESIVDKCLMPRRGLQRGAGPQVTQLAEAQSGAFSTMLVAGRCSSLVHTKALCGSLRCSCLGAEAVRRTGGGLSGTLTAAETTAPELGPDVGELALQVTAPAAGVLRVRITGAGAPRWEVPRWLYPADSVAGARPSAGAPRELGSRDGRHRLRAHIVA